LAGAARRDLPLPGGAPRNELEKVHPRR
jgi:hypothetical protein